MGKWDATLTQVPAACPQCDAVLDGSVRFGHDGSMKTTYHAGNQAHHIPMCGGGSHTMKMTILTPAEWNATAEQNRCQHCVRAIAERKAAKERNRKL